MTPGTQRPAAQQRLLLEIFLSLLLTWFAPAFAVQPSDSYEASTAESLRAVQPKDVEGTWIVNSGEPGSDVPPVGRSLFDHLVTDHSGPEPVYRVLFPFAALRDSLERRLRKNSNGTTPIQQLLIPLGRSLQRTAAAPDFFRYPRVVLAVDGEPLADLHESGMFMQDRLYLGYLEKPGVLEVISYNEGAGRFEFQIVSDYREGGSPKVVYANRAVCTACHQNATPIFARPLWGETNANPEIAALLKAEQRDYYGIPQQVGIDIPAAVDAATDRANRIPAVHFLWRLGCGENPQSRAARSCRGKALGFALQFRLTKSLGFSHGGHPEWAEFLQAFETNWRARWPQGLLLSSPDVPNRIPVQKSGRVRPAASTMQSITAFAGDDRLHQQRHIPSELEPLQPRAPLERWQAKQGAMELVTGIAGFFAQIDIERLDAQLLNLGREDDTRQIRYQSGCRLTSKPMKGGAVRLGFKCDEPSTSLHLEGRLYLRNGQLLRGTLDRLVTSEGVSIREFTLTGEAIERTEDGWQIRLGLRRAGLYGRLPNGNGLNRLQLDWTDLDPLASPRDQIGTGKATLETLEDFTILKRAIARISESGGDKFDAFSAKPLRRIAVVKAIADELGMPSVAECCLDSSNLPTLQVDKPDPAAVTAVDDTAPESVFYRRCSLCHRSHERFPPNFLAGDRKAVREKLAQCAERLYLRLSMWDLPEEHRAKTPMPPLQAFLQLGLEPDEWKVHPELTALQGYVRQLLMSQTGKAPELEELVARGYENLRPCLAQVD